MRMIMRILSSALLIALCGFPALATPFQGMAVAIDGDSIRVDGKEVRLFGIDAPEIGQTCKRDGQDWACGSEAAARLARLVTGKVARCTSLGTDQYGRTLGRCSAGGTDINRNMVATGFAVAFRRYSMDYVSAEESARVNKRGIWAGTFEMPSDVRHSADPSTQRQTSNAGGPGKLPKISNLGTKPRPSGHCRIKGNRGRNGWIYHVPGMRYYNQTIAEEMFCTEGEARAAGYRRAKV